MSSSDARFGRAFAGQTGYVPRSIVAVPLVDEHGTIGVLEVLDKRDEVAFSLRDIELASVFARQAAIAISASRVERDVASLLATVLAALAGPAADGARRSDQASVDEIVAAATAGLEGEEGGRLWALVEQVARVRAGRSRPARARRGPAGRAGRPRRAAAPAAGSRRR